MSTLNKSSDESVQVARKPRVAVVGSGLAGLTCAWLLERDPLRRYDVEVYESGDRPSLDSASIYPESEIYEVTKIDVPMRAFTGGYYRHLKAMYDWLGIPYHSQPLRFVFSKDHEDNSSRVTREPDTTYFVHASNSHVFPPSRPRNVGIITHLLEVVFVTAAFLYFSTCCFFIPPSNSDETFDQYVQRICLPQRFISKYLLPLMAAIATCSHQEILNFPASDLVNYKKLITGHKQYVVTGGVRKVEKILTHGLEIQLRSRVTRVEPRGTGVEVTVESRQEEGSVRLTAHQFDHVVMAVAPNVAAAIFEPANRQLSLLPVRKVETVVHRTDNQRNPEPAAANHHVPDVISLSNSYRTGGWTQASHVLASGVVVTSCPLFDSQKIPIISRSIFTRTLRTPHSRSITQNLFEPVRKLSSHSEKGDSWTNGALGVWIVGAWCWDGMVLLEGAVVSAERVVKALGVEIPWHQNNKRSMM